MKTFKENLNNLVLSLCEIVVGVLLLIDPVGYTTDVIIVVGVVMTVMGVISAVSHFRIPPEEALRNHQLAIGMIQIAIGVFCVTHSGWFIVTFPVLTLLYGVVLLGTGFFKVQWAVDLLRLKRKQWFMALLSAALSFLAAFIIFRNPVESTTFLWIYTAVTLIAEAVIDLITIFFRKKQPGKGLIEMDAEECETEELDDDPEQPSV